MYIYVFSLILKCLENGKKKSIAVFVHKSPNYLTHWCHFILISLTTKRRRYGILLYRLYMINRNTDKVFPLWTNNANKNICHRNYYYLPIHYYLCLVRAHDYKWHINVFKRLLLKKTVKITILLTYSYFSHYKKVHTSKYFYFITVTVYKKANFSNQ